MKIIYSSLILLVVFFQSCEDKQATAVKNNFSSFIAQNEGAVSYGKVSLGDLLEKSDLKSLPSFGEVIKNQFESLKVSIGVDQPIYFALDGPLDRDGMPKRSYFFFQINNKDSVEAMFSEMGYFFEEENDLFYAAEESMALGFNDDMAIMLQGQYEDDLKTLVYDAFKEASAKNEDERIASVLDLEGDILIASHLENLYNTGNTELNKLPEDQQKLLKEMAANAHYATTIDFRNGEIAIDGKAYFDEALSKAMVFKDMGDFDPMAEMNVERPLMAFYANVDVPKMEQLMEKFYPEPVKELYKSMGTTGLILKGLGGEGINALVNGQMAMALATAPVDFKFDDELPSGMTFYAGVGGASSSIVDVLVDLADAGDITRVEKGLFRYNGMEAKLSGKSLIVKTLNNENSPKIMGREQFPEGCEGFGVKPMAFYLDLKALFAADIDVRSSDLKSVIDLLDFAYMEADNEGSAFKIIFKDDSKNVLKAVVDALRGDLEEMIGSGMPI